MKVLIYLFFFIVTTINIAAQSNDWSEALNKNNISIHVRKVNGSTFKEFKARTVIKKDINDVTSFILDFGSYPKWMYNYSKCNLLKDSSNIEYYYYAIIDAPWPVSQRDLIVRCNIQKTHEKTILNLSCMHNFITLNNDYVRIKVFKGRWELTKLSDNQTEVVCYLHVEPNGNIPGWFANILITDAPYNTFLKMNELMK